MEAANYDVSIGKSTASPTRKYGYSRGTSG